MPNVAYLYEFVAAPTTARYTSANVNVTYSGNVYTAQPIVCSMIDGGVRNSRATITLDDTLYPASAYVFGAPTQSVAVTIRRLSGAIVFAGFVGACELRPRDSRRAKLECVAHLAKGVMVPRRRIAPGCGHDLGDARCGVNLAALGVAGTSVTVSPDRRTITSAAWGAAASGYYTAGRMTLGQESMFIVEHDGSDLRLLRPFVATSGVYTAFPGCDKSIGTCVARFANGNNFGGFPSIPNYNPTRGFGTEAGSGD